MAAELTRILVKSSRTHQQIIPVVRILFLVSTKCGEPLSAPSICRKRQPLFKCSLGRIHLTIFIIILKIRCVLLFPVIFRCENSLKCRWYSSWCFNEGLMSLLKSEFPAPHFLLSAFRSKNTEFGNSYSIALMPRAMFMLWFLDAWSGEQYMLYGEACTWADPRIDLDTG